ncbi:MAG: RNA polymerase sigma factor [bacterium]|nr:RNA polymerase sigma factor [bacterium]
MTSKKELELQNLLDLAYEDHKQGLNSFAFFKVHNKTISEDLVQNTFMKTWIYLLKGGKIDLMRAFLYHVLNDLVIDEYRKRKNISLDNLLEKGFDPYIIETDRLINILDGQSAELLINQLPLKYQQVIRMRYVQELTLKEIATATGQTKNTIAVQAHRGLEKLKLLYNHT